MKVVVCFLGFLAMMLLANNSYSQNDAKYSFEALSKGNVPTIFIHQGKLSASVENEDLVRVVVDVQSIDKLYELRSDYKQVEIIYIQLNNKKQLNERVKFSSLTHFRNLKHIYIACSFTFCENSDERSVCESESINEMLVGEKPSHISINYSSEVNE